MTIMESLIIETIGNLCLGNVHLKLVPVFLIFNFINRKNCFAKA